MTDIPNWKVPLEDEATRKEFVIPRGRGLDFKNEKKWAIDDLWYLLGWRTTRNTKGTYDVDEVVIAPKEEE